MSDKQIMKSLFEATMRGRRFPSKSGEEFAPSQFYALAATDFELTEELARQHKFEAEFHGGWRSPLVQMVEQKDLGPRLQELDSLRPRRGSGRWGLRVKGNR